MSKPQTVWIVQHDESPDNTILGVFATQDEASNFAREIECDFPGGVLYSEFPIGYTFNKGTGFAEFGPA